MTARAINSSSAPGRATQNIRMLCILMPDRRLPCCGRPWAPGAAASRPWYRGPSKPPGRRFKRPWRDCPDIRKECRTSHITFHTTQKSGGMGFINENFDVFVKKEEGIGNLKTAENRVPRDKAGHGFLLPGPDFQDERKRRSFSLTRTPENRAMSKRSMKVSHLQRNI